MLRLLIASRLPGPRWLSAFTWEYYFLNGKQKRRKVWVINGEPVRDMDEWLLKNADDLYLHQAERWDLIAQRELANPKAFEDSNKVDTPRRTVRVDMSGLEDAIEGFGMPDYLALGEINCAYLNLKTGEVVLPMTEEENEDYWLSEDFLRVPDDLEERTGYGDMEAFVESLEEGPVRAELARAIRGQGPFRRFKGIVFGRRDVEFRHSWIWFERRRRRERIIKWLHDENIDPLLDPEETEPPKLPDKRPDLLRAVLEFVRDVRGSPGVRRIALLGSLVTSKRIPRDVDVLVDIDDETPLSGIARRGRQLCGKTMQTGDSCGAEVFLCSPRGDYIGRTCPWKECAPGIRMACEALHCGRRHYLYDDLQNLKLDSKIIAEPPLELWPEIVARVELPDDVKKELVGPLSVGVCE